MALFQRSLYGEEPNFSNLFRLLDGFENYSREVQGPHGRGGRRHHRVFNPRFDVRETETAYELHGELPGLDRNNVQIDFTEPQTMTVHGRVERTYTAGTPPAGLVEDGNVSGAATPEEASHHATVSDEDAEAAKEQGEASTAAAAVAPRKEEPPKPKERYWHQERSVGEFHRTFTFPGRVDEAGVSASLNNGILTINVPKAAKHESRRITVN